MKTFKYYCEQVDKKDTITMDIPLLIRVLELAREDIKDDADLHRMVERLIDIRNRGTLTMDDYNFIAHIKENFNMCESLTTKNISNGEHEVYWNGEKTHLHIFNGDRGMSGTGRNNYAIHNHLTNKTTSIGSLQKAKKTAAHWMKKHHEMNEMAGGMGGGMASTGPTNVTGTKTSTDPVSATAVDMRKRKKKRDPRLLGFGKRKGY